MTVSDFKLYANGVPFYMGAVGHQYARFDLGLPRVGKIENLPYLPKQSPAMCDLPLPTTRIVLRCRDILKAQTGSKMPYTVRLLIAIDTDLH